MVLAAPKRMPSSEPLTRAAATMSMLTTLCHLVMFLILHSIVQLIHTIFATVPTSVSQFSDRFCHLLAPYQSPSLCAAKRTSLTPFLTAPNRETPSSSTPKPTSGHTTPKFARSILRHSIFQYATIYRSLPPQPYSINLKKKAKNLASLSISTGLSCQKNQQKQGRRPAKTLPKKKKLNPFTTKSLNNS